MDNSYKCELEVWGSKACLYTGRVLTAPVGYKPTILIKRNNQEERKILPSDDAFKNSIEYFIKCIKNNDCRMTNYETIEYQAKLVTSFFEMAK